MALFTRGSFLQCLLFFLEMTVLQHRLCSTSHQVNMSSQQAVYCISYISSGKEDIQYSRPDLQLDTESSVTRHPKYEVIVGKCFGIIRGQGI